MAARINKIWLKKHLDATDPIIINPPIEIRLDWDNDRHHAAAINPPYDVQEVVKALKAVFHLIVDDPNLKDG